MSALRTEDDGHCFVCGPDNKEGLGVSWVIEGDTTTGVFSPQKKHQGWKGIVHGGLLAALLDEAMTRLVWKRCGSAVTAEMTVRFVNPAPVGQPITIHGRVLKEAKKLVWSKSEASGPDGTLFAKAEGKSVKL